ncbi:MAG: 2,3,4,5-tetrahydropyridine-2,6-dicarboxylate N-succinyltransferase [Patescibacteria group bacterium]
MRKEQLHKKMIALATLSVEELRRTAAAHAVVVAFLQALNEGSLRSAEKNTKGIWQANAWVKEGILVCMRLGELTRMSHKKETLQFSDKDTLPLRSFDFAGDNLRIVPGGTSVRDGVYFGKNVIVMPPSYIAIGSYIGSGTMIDSHALVGSCAQVGERCHISAGAQVGGVLEPVNANPCIVEDEVLMGINTSIAEGVILHSRVVLTPGVNITSATPVYDLVKEKVYRATRSTPLEIPEGAVVVNGTRPKGENAFADAQGIHIQVPVIIKYRDEKTALKTLLEEALR